MHADRFIATVLFTDIVGSTERASELGDRRWRSLREQHHAIVREELARWGGSEVSEAGDGFLSLFDNPAQAILSAAAIRDRVAELGLEVRCGVHMGEIERSADGSLGGITLHIGARVASKAGASDVLVSSAVRDVEAGSGFGFEDRGRHELKGVSGQWRLFAVTGVPAEAEPPGPLPWIERVSRRALTGALAVVVVLGVAGLYTVVGDRGEGLSPPVAIAGAAPGIAVLPFTVRGEGLEIWREGMVDLLSTGLDGAANLRAISSRTVLARWQERVSEAPTADLSTTLAVAGAAGARYALVGSAVAIGPDVRLVVDVYDIDTGDRLGQAQVEGRPDDVLALCDRLGVEALAIILEKGEGEIAPINLARVMSDTTAALRAYLEGEVALRHFDLTAAEDAYQRAVDADSMFALAHFRLASVLAWEQGVNPGMGLQRHGEHIDRAVRLAHRLPRREAMLVRAKRALDRGSLDGVEPLRQGVRTYPDDSEIWFQLGDTYYHRYGALAAAEEVEQAFERAVELDPLNARNLFHLVGLTIDRGDSAQAARVVERYGELSPGSWSDSLNQLLFALAYGDPAHRVTAVRSLDTREPERLVPLLFRFLHHPRHVEAKRTIVDAAYRKGDKRTKEFMAQWRYWLALTERGHLEEGLEYLNDPVVTNTGRVIAHWAALYQGYPVSDDPIETFFGEAVIDSTMNPGLAWVAGTHAVDHGRWDNYRAAITELDRRREIHRAGGDSIPMRTDEAWRESLEGYALWRRGKPAEALSHLEGFWWALFFGQSDAVRTWLAELYVDLGRPEDAEPLYRGYQFGYYPLSQYRLGQIYEQLEEYDKARESYEYFVEYWRDADPELQPLVEEARQAIIRLEGLQRD
jgi:tetratricopeptide (TPR) repeat protein